MIEEPANRSIVAWLNGNQVPTAVHVRIDEYAEKDAPTERWYNADEDRGLDEGPETWEDLVGRLGDFGYHGPVLLVPKALGGAW